MRLYRAYQLVGASMVAVAIFMVLLPFWKSLMGDGTMNTVWLAGLSYEVLAFIFVILYNTVLWKRVVGTPWYQARLAKEKAVWAVGPFERGENCDTYMAERLKELYPEGEVLANGSFILPFAGGRSVLYYAHGMAELGIWPSGDQYPCHCFQACWDKPLKRCKTCSRAEQQAQSIKLYMDSVRDESRIHVLGLNRYGQERDNHVIKLSPKQREMIERLLPNHLYGFGEGLPPFTIPQASSILWETLPGERCAYAEIRSYRGTYDSEMWAKDEKPVPGAHTPVWPVRKEAEPDTEKQPTEQ